MDKDLAGAGRQRAQMRLAERATTDGVTTAVLPAFGVANQLRGQYFYNAEQWFAQQSTGMNSDIVWRTVLAGAPVQAAKDVPPTLVGLRSLALDPMYQLK